PFDIAKLPQALPERLEIRRGDFSSGAGEVSDGRNLGGLLRICCQAPCHSDEDKRGDQERSRAHEISDSSVTRLAPRPEASRFLARRCYFRTPGEISCGSCIVFRNRLYTAGCALELGEEPKFGECKNAPLRGCLVCTGRCNV